MIVVRQVNKDGHVYFHADDLALLLDERGKQALDNDSGGDNGRLIQKVFGEISKFIREMARADSVEMSPEQVLATHIMEDDPPANALTRMRRRTCTVCRATEMIRPDNTSYGSATERTCEEQQERNEEYRRRYGRT